MQNSKTSTMGERLRYWREIQEWSQTELGEKLAIGQRKVGYYEGEAKAFPPELLAGLADLGVNLNWLATGQGEMLAGAGAPVSSFAVRPIVAEAWLLLEEMLEATPPEDRPKGVALGEALGVVVHRLAEDRQRGSTERVRSFLRDMLDVLKARETERKGAGAAPGRPSKS